MTSPEPNVERPSNPTRRRRQRRWPFTLAATLSVAALVTMAVCAVLIVGEQREQTRLARESACFQRSIAWSALPAGLVGPDSTLAGRQLIEKSNYAVYGACQRVDISPYISESPTTP